MKPMKFKTSAAVTGLVAAALISTPSANAFSDADAICTTLDYYPTVSGVTSIVSPLLDTWGYTPHEPAVTVMDAVKDQCPEQSGFIKRFSSPDRYLETTGNTGTVTAEVK